jgi:hypothetical protein
MHVTVSAYSSHPDMELPNDILDILGVQAASKCRTKGQPMQRWNEKEVVGDKHVRSVNP